MGIPIVLRQLKKGMSVIYLLLGVSISVAVLFFLIFWLAVRKGQFDDSYTPSVRMLFEDELVTQGEAPDEKEENASPTHNLTNSLHTNGDSAV